MPRFLLVALLLPFLPLQGPPPVDVRVGARSIQPGELVVLTLTTTQPVQAIEVHAFDQDRAAFRAGPTTWRVVVGIDLDVSPGPHPVTIRTVPAAVDVTETLVVEPKAFPTRRLTVNDAFVNPPAAVQARIAREAEELNRIWRSSTREPLWDGVFVRPVPQAANSAFGSRSILNGVPRSPHGGADFASPAGTPIKAPNRGRIVLAKDLYYTGNTVVVDHGAGLVSLFAHLSAIDVAADEVVARDAILGRVGATGRVTGPHLHWTLRADGARVDPLSLLAVLGAD